MNIRLLKADEIDARVQSVKENGLILLLYKDARCDMKILDETFGLFGWQRKHEVVNGNLFCTVSIYDNEKKQWIEKQDVGTESYTEKEKGQASDSFKRACFNIGIGRELYTSPFIWINNTGDIKNGKCFTKFKVKEIGYNEQREINHLIITDDKGNERYKMKNSNKVSETKKEYPVNGPISNGPENHNKDKCNDCSKELTTGEKTYSTKNLGKALCFNCQQKYKK